VMLVASVQPPTKMTEQRQKLVALRCFNLQRPTGGQIRQVT
jgi:hypothetical protein